MSSTVILANKLPANEYDIASDEKRSSDAESGGAHGLDDVKEDLSGEPAAINAIGHLNVYDDRDIAAQQPADNLNAGVRKAQQAQAVWGKVRALDWPGWFLRRVVLIGR